MPAIVCVHGSAGGHRKVAAPVKRGSDVFEIAVSEEIARQRFVSYAKLPVKCKSVKRIAEEGTETE